MKAFTKLLVILVLAGGVAGVFLQRRAISEARKENQNHRSEGQLVGKLTRENSGIEQVQLEDQQVTRLRAENRELHKLRNEVRQLREQARQLAGLQAENSRLRSGQGGAASASRPASDQAGLIRTDTLTFSGYSSPEAAFKSTLWAMGQGNVQQFLNSFSPAVQDKLTEKLSSGGIEDIRQQFAAIKGFRVAASRPLSDTEVQLGLQMQIGIEGQEMTEEVALPFKLVGSEWKLDMGL